jgi:hypothetical protein
MDRRASNFQPVSFTVSAWEWVYATNLSRLQRETSKRHVGEAHSVLTTAILLPQRPSCYWCKIVSLRMLANLRLADLRLTTAQQRSTGQNLPSDLYVFLTLVQFGGEWSASRPGRFTTEERATIAHCLGRWVGELEKRKFLTFPGLELRLLGRPARSQSLYRLSYRSSSLNTGTTFLAHFPKEGLCDFLPVCGVCIPPPPNELLKGWTSLYEIWYVYHVIANLNGAHHKSLPSVFAYVYVARQRLYNSITLATNMRATTE